MCAVQSIQDVKLLIDPSNSHNHKIHYFAFLRTRNQNKGLTPSLTQHIKIKNLIILFMSQPFTIRNYEPGDEHGLVELLQLVFNGWPHFDIPCTSLEHWKWKYLDNPYKKRTIPIAIIGDKVVGSNHGVTRRVKLFDKMLLCSQGTDLTVHPDYRRMGIYAKTSGYKTQHYKDNGFSFAWAVTGNPIVFDSNIEWGRRSSPHRVNTLIRVNDIDLHFKMKEKGDDVLRQMGAKVLKGLGDLSLHLSRPLSKDEVDYKLNEINAFDDGYSMFWKSVQPSYDLIYERSPEYMNWRYLDRRAGDFKVIAAIADGVWLGYIIYRINRYNKDYPETYIADILTLPGRSEVASELISEVNRRIDKEQLNVIYSWAIENNSYFEILQREGYLNSRYNPYFIYQNISLTSEWEEMYRVNPGRMQVHFGDCDWV